MNCEYQTDEFQMFSQFDHDQPNSGFLSEYFMTENISNSPYLLQNYNDNIVPMQDCNFEADLVPEIIVSRNSNQDFVSETFLENNLNPNAPTIDQNVPDSCKNSSTENIVDSDRFSLLELMNNESENEDQAEINGNANDIENKIANFCNFLEPKPSKLDACVAQLQKTKNLFHVINLNVLILKILSQNIATLCPGICHLNMNIG